MKRILIFISLFLSVTVFGQGVAIRSNGGIGTNLTIYTKLTIPNTDGAWFQPFPSHGIGWWDPGAGNYAFWTVDDGLFANTFSIPSLAQATKSVALIGIPPNGTVEGSTLPNDATKFLNGQGGFAALYASNVVSGGQIPVAAISGLSPTFNSITGTNMSLYGPNGGAIKLYDSSGNGPYAQLGTNDNLILSNSATAMTVTLTNGGANFGSNVVAKHFYGDGSTLTGISGGSATNAVANILTNSVAINAGVITNLNFIPGSSMTITGSMLNGQANIGFSASGGGGSGTVSNAAALTSGQFVIGQGNGAVATTLDGSALTNTTEYGFLASSETFTNTTTMQTRATNYAIAITNRCNGDQSGGYITNNSAGIYQIAFQVGNWSGSGDKAVAIFTNNVVTYLRFSALLGTTRSGSGSGIISLPASVAISLGALSSDASTFGNYSFSVRRMQ